MAAPQPPPNYQQAQIARARVNNQRRVQRMGTPQQDVSDLPDNNASQMGYIDPQSGKALTDPGVQARPVSRENLAKLNAAGNRVGSEGLEGTPNPTAPVAPPAAAKPATDYTATNKPITKNAYGLDLKTNLEKLIGNSEQIINNVFDATGNPVAVRSHFFNVLSKWESSLPLNQLWCLVFNVPPAIKDNLTSVNEESNDAPAPGTTSYGMQGWGEEINASWGVDMGRETVHTPPMYRSHIGCAFAQTVGIPPENLGTETVGIPNRGFIKAPVVKQRNPFGSLNVEFLETNVSFVDFLIRPWVIQTSHYGLVARPVADLDIKTDMFLLNFGRMGVDPASHHAAGGGDPGQMANVRGFVLRKMFHFKDCFPINVANERYSYTPEGGPDRRDVEFVFTRYQAILPEGGINHALEMAAWDDAAFGGNAVSLPAKSKRSGGGLLGMPGRIANGIMNSGRNMLGL
tara:strand:- start:36365 stop:37741 length:1377 start_codon:yes stop_codon:yes gene_type:complete